MSNFYDDPEIIAEKVKLIEEIVIPKITIQQAISQNKIEDYTLEYFYDRDENFRKYISSKKIRDYSGEFIGKFSIPIMIPLLDSSEIIERQSMAPTMKGNINKLTTNKYSSTNYISLHIPVYLIKDFGDVVPKGTEFIVTSINGGTELGDLKIVGLNYKN